MKNATIRSWTLAALTMLAFAGPPLAQAGDPGRKLGRGFANVLFGVAEIPGTIAETSREHGGGAGATWGVLKGLGRFVARELVGVYEIVTFPLPFPRNYDPILQPEFPLGGDKGDY